MIRQLHIKNFKCLLDLDVSLGPFTVLIGPNDSGKSSLLDAIQMLGRTATTPFNQVFAAPVSLDNLVWRREQERSISWEVTGTTAGGEFSYVLELSPQKPLPIREELLLQGQRRLLLNTDARGNVTANLLRTPGPNWQQLPTPLWHTILSTTPTLAGSGDDFAEVAASLASSVKYRLDPEMMRKDVADLHPDPILNDTGANLVKALDAVQNGPDRSAFSNLEKALHQAIPSLQGVFLPLLPPGKRGVAFTLSGNGGQPVPIPAALVSDGALLMTGILTLAYGNGPEILFFEEPENGLHYSLLKMAMDLLHKISIGEVGNRPRQVIVTTHSPLLLNFAKPEEVLVFRRSAEEGTKVTPLREAPNVDSLLREFSTGELWYLLGEEALVKEPKP